MSIIKCKMCGGTLEINNNETVAVCEYCGTKQTLPKLDSERKSNLYDRANHFRRNNEFEKAMGIYEKILNEDNTDAEAYWSLVLCRYGIEYVEDPTSKKRVPTINRSQFTSVFADEDYKSALCYADAYQREVYEEEAKEIDEIQKGILAISQNEAPFDVFICYKESDNSGKRTLDSVLAQELYHELVEEGFKVFFARITLEDKLGTEYEPYIFAALNSSRVMIVLGTKPEYFNAAWVKNEWSRYLALIKNGAKKMLIPAYKDMDPYDLPEDFSHLHAQDMSKLGFMQDLIRGIKKIIQLDESQSTIQKTVVVDGNANMHNNAESLLKRVFLFLEDGDWASADEYSERVLDINPENARAYLGKLMAELQMKTQEDLKNCLEPFDDRNNYKKVLRFADEKLALVMKGYIKYINERNEKARLECAYLNAVKTMNSACTEGHYINAAKLFRTIKGYKDSEALSDECLEKAEISKKEAIYASAKNKMVADIIEEYEKAILQFETISDWKDSGELIAVCFRKMEEIKLKQEEERLEHERIAEIKRVEEEKRTKRNKVLGVMATIVVAFAVVFVFVVIPNIRYNEAVELMDAEEYRQAALILSSIENYKNSKTLKIECMQECREDLRKKISAGGNHTVGLKPDGTVVATGYNGKEQCEVSGWTDIVAVSCGGQHTVGLKADGTLVATGCNDEKQCDVLGLTDIIAISAGGYHTVGLKSNGAVVAVGANERKQCEVLGWTDIVEVFAARHHTVGLKSDGTVVATGSNEKEQCEVSGWTDIVAVSAGDYHTVGLKSDGTVVAVGDNTFGQCKLSEWTDIVAVCAGRYYTVGLKSDGTAVGVGNDDYGQKTNVSEWTNMVAVCAGSRHVVGMKVDGTMVAIGAKSYERCNVNDWNLLE